MSDNTNKTSRTSKYLTAILKGLWIINYQWIIDSLSSKKWLNEESYEISGDSVIIVYSKFN